MDIGLSDFIAANKARIVDECEAFARTLLPAADGMDREALRDHLEEILVDVAANMKTPQTELERSEKSKGRAPVIEGLPDPASQTHGGMREASGFDLNQTASEYRALRASVIRMWLETSPTLGPEQVEELTRFNEAIDQALAETLLQFTGAADQSRELFLAVLSHEMRTPLSTIVGSAQMLLLLNEQQRVVTNAASQVLRGAMRIRSVLDDLLDYVRSSIDGGLRVQLASARLDDLCKRVAREVETAMPGSHVDLVQRGDMNGTWDEQRLGQAMSNLMTNAIKYGRAEKSIRVSLDGTRQREVVVAVHNEGSRIPDEKLGTLFEPLVRGNEGDPTGYSLGLGLFVVREIAIAHGGKVDVSSSDDGTTFRMRLPRSPEGTPPAAVGRMRRI